MKETLFGGHGTQRPPSGGHATSTQERTNTDSEVSSLLRLSLCALIHVCMTVSERVSVCVCVSVHLCFNIIILFCFKRLRLFDVSQIFPAANCCAQDFSSFLIL